MIEMLKRITAVLLFALVCLIATGAFAGIPGEEKYYCTNCLERLTGTGKCKYCGGRGKKEIPVYNRVDSVWSNSFARKTSGGYRIGADFATSQAGDFRTDEDGNDYLSFKVLLLKNNKVIDSKNVDAYWKGEVIESGIYYGSYIFRTNVEFKIDASVGKGDYVIELYDFVPNVHGGPYYEKSDLKITIPDKMIVNSGSCGENASFVLDEDGVLTISGTGVVDGKQREKDWYGGESDCEIKKIVINEGLTGIGDDAFSCCDAAESVVIPDSVTWIGDGAFASCRSLKKLTVPNGVTRIGKYAFYACEGLTDLILPDSLISIGECAFNSCTGLTRFTIPKNVTYIGDDFLGYNYDIYGNPYNLTEITVAPENPGFSSADGILYNKDKTMLILCPRSRTRVNIPEGVIGIGRRAFSSSNLTNLVIPDSVTSIGDYAFEACGELTDIVLSKNMTHIGNGIFNSCWELKSVKIPDNVTGIGENAFSYCYNLKDLVIPDSVTSIGDYAFDGCTGLTNIVLSKNITRIGYGIFMYCNGLTNITIPDRVTAIGEYAFWNCEKLTKLLIPYGLSIVGKNAFDDCGALSDVYYGGAAMEKELIAVHEGNKNLLDAKWHFNLSPDPFEDSENKTPGDVNDDGVTDGRDCIRLMKYLAGETDRETGEAIRINEVNADVTGDGVVDELDLLRLMKYMIRK